MSEAGETVSEPEGSGQSDSPSSDRDATQYMEGGSSGESDVDIAGRTFDDFRVLRKLGAGGMASVYLADQMSLGRRVAIKLLSPSPSDEATAQRSLARFRTEAMAAAALTHPNIVQVYTVGESQGMRYIAMEYVPGRNLSELVRRQGTLSIKVAVHVIRQAARALSAAHAAGVIHRDIKPANILVSPKGDVKVADFGLSQLTLGPQASPGLTQTGTTVGTPRYMSPEQIEGRAVDARADLYSLGVTLYYVLAGRPPFDSDSPMVLASKHLRDAPPPIQDFRSDTPEGLVDLIEQLLEKDPEDRMATADEVVRALGSVATTLNPLGEDDHGDPPSSPKSSPARASKPRAKAETAPTERKRSRFEPVLIGVAAISVGLGAAWMNRPSNPLDESVTFERLASAKEQYLAAMISGDDADFRAVETLWPSETRWVTKAKSQRLLSAVQDPRRADEARELIDEFSRPAAPPELQTIAAVAEVFLLADGGKGRMAQSRINPKLEADVRDSLSPAWINLLEDAKDLISQPRS